MKHADAPLSNDSPTARQLAAARAFHSPARRTTDKYARTHPTHAPCRRAHRMASSAALVQNWPSFAVLLHVGDSVCQESGKPLTSTSLHHAVGRVASLLSRTVLRAVSRVGTAVSLFLTSTRGTKCMPRLRHRRMPTSGPYVNSVAIRCVSHGQLQFWASCHLQGIRRHPGRR